MNYCIILLAVIFPVGAPMNKGVLPITYIQDETLDQLR